MNITLYFSRILLFIFVYCFVWLRDDTSASSSQELMLSMHNYARSLIGVKPLIWDERIALSAQSWADYLAKNDVFRHADQKSRGGMGENLYMISGGKNIESDGDDALVSWIEESHFYDHDRGTCQSGKVCGHYTQIIWKNTKKVGCAKSVRKEKSKTKIYWVCRYDPPGNIIGQNPF